MKIVPLLILSTFLGSSLGESQTQRSDLGRSYYHFSLAKMHHFLKEYAEALGEFEKAIALNPKSSQLRVEFAGTLLDAGKTRRAIEECQYAIELDMDNSAAHFLLGRAYFGDRKEGSEHILDKAIAEFERGIELEPDSLEALFFLGLMYFQRNDYQSAADLFGRYTQLRPGYSKAYYYKAVAHTKLNEMEVAIKTLKESLTFRTDQNNLKLLGQLYEQEGQYEKAVQVYDRALQSTSDSTIQRNLGRLLLIQRRFKEAIPTLQQAVAQSPQDPEIRLDLGKAFNEEKRYSEAAEVFEAVLEMDSDHPEAHFELGLTLTEMGEYHQAIAKFERLLEITKARKNLSAVQSRLGLLYQETRQFDRAIQTFRDVVETNPGDLGGKLRLAVALKEAGQLEEALSFTDHLVKNHPEEPDTLICRAEVLSTAGRLSEAIELLKEQIKEAPDAEPFYSVAGQLYVEHEKYQDAEKMIRQGLSYRPESERMQFQAAAIYERQKEFEKAEAGFKKILGTNPEHAAVLNYLGYMLADRGLRLQEALRYIKKAVEMEPYNGAYLDSLGWVYFKLNQLAPAEINLKRAAQINDADSTIYDHLGDLYYELGDYDKARESYAQSMQFARKKEERERVREKLAHLEELVTKKVAAP